LNGEAPSLRATSPAPGLDTMLRQAIPSDTERARSQGEESYATALTGAARRADGIDSVWDRYASECVSTTAATSGRRWLAALETNGVRLSTNARIDCRGWLDSISSDARTIDQEVRNANEAARRAGVFPGVLRDLRRRHRLDWAGWDR
jgi:hypothetical protein